MATLRKGLTARLSRGFLRTYFAQHLALSSSRHSLGGHGAAVATTGQRTPRFSSDPWPKRTPEPRSHHRLNAASMGCYSDAETGQCCSVELQHGAPKAATDVVGPPPGLSRISTGVKCAEAELQHLDVGFSLAQYDSPSPTKTKEVLSQPGDYESPVLVDALICETVGEMLLGDGLF